MTIRKSQELLTDHGEDWKCTASDEGLDAQTGLSNKIGYVTLTLKYILLSSFASIIYIKSTL